MNNKTKSLYNKRLRSYFEDLGIHQNISHIYHCMNKTELIRTKLILNTKNRNEIKKCSNILYEYAQRDSVQITSKKSYGKVRNEILFNNEAGDYVIGAPFVANVNNATILPYSGYVVDYSGSILLDAANSRESKTIEYFTDNFQTHELFMREHYPSHFNSTTNLNCAVPLLGPPEGHYTGYYHWMHNYLPLLEGVELFADIEDFFPKLIIRDDSPKWVEETLYELGYKEQIYCWDETCPLSVDRLVVPSVRRIEERFFDTFHNNSYFYKVGSPSAFKWLRMSVNGLISEPPSSQPNRILITRGDANERRFLNKDSLLTLLSDYGFVEYQLSELSFTEQVSLFSSADVVVGAHGAGLVNTIFSDDIVILELFGKKIKPTFSILSDVCSNKYYPILSTPEAGDIYVDKKSLCDIESILDSLDLECAHV